MHQWPSVVAPYSFSPSKFNSNPIPWCHRVKRETLTLTTLPRINDPCYSLAFLRMHQKSTPHNKPLFLLWIVINSEFNYPLFTYLSNSNIHLQQTSGITNITGLSADLHCLYLNRYYVDPTRSWHKHVASVYHNTSNHAVSTSQHCYSIDVHTHGIEHYFSITNMAVDNHEFNVIT